MSNLPWTKLLHDSSTFKHLLCFYPANNGTMDKFNFLVIKFIKIAKDIKMLTIYIQYTPSFLIVDPFMLQ